MALAVRRWGPFPFEDQNEIIAKNIHASRNLNTEIFNYIKIAQGAKVMKNKVGSGNSNVELFKVLGKSKCFQLNPDQNYLFVSIGLEKKQKPTILL